MSTLKRNRAANDFEVYSHWSKTDDEITDLLLRDFGYSVNKSAKRSEKRLQGRDISELSDAELASYTRWQARDDELRAWFIERMRDKIFDCQCAVTSYIYMANSTYPTTIAEYTERRLYQDKAIGELYVIIQLVQKALTVLPVDINASLRFARTIQHEIDLIKGWRKSDNKYKKSLKGTS